jgi:hypothetical protein
MYTFRVSGLGFGVGFGFRFLLVLGLALGEGYYLLAAEPLLKLTVRG